MYTSQDDPCPLLSRPGLQPCLLRELGQPQIRHKQLVTSESSSLPHAFWSRGTIRTQASVPAPRVWASLPLSPRLASFRRPGTKGKVCIIGLGPDTSPSPTSLLATEVTKPLSLVAGLPRRAEAREAPGWTHELGEAMSRSTGPALATKTNLQLLLPSEGGRGGVQPEALSSSHWDW